MCPVIQSINYRFSPDKQIQNLCENIVDELRGNGIALSDIAAESVTDEQVTITTVFNWHIKVSLKQRRLNKPLNKHMLLHNSAAEAQNIAKKQGQLIISSSSGKIELIRNINDDPAHYYKHGTIKLDGGKKHAFTQSCSNHCDHGQVQCKYCNGRGTKKVSLKKDNLLSTTTSFNPANICTNCGGKGSIDCHECSGSGEHTHIYEVDVTASRQHKNLIQTNDTKIKNLITNFIFQQTYSDLIDTYLSPVVIKLEDVDETRCNVIYQSQTKYSLLKLSVYHKFYEVLAFGDHSRCINKPRILNDTLLTTVNTIIGSNPNKNTALKLLQLQSLDVLKPLMASADNRSDQELESVLYSNTKELLSQDIAAAIIKQISTLKAAITPRYSITAWLPITLTGICSALYLGLPLDSAFNKLITLSSVLSPVLISGYLLSKFFTKRQREKHNQRMDRPTYERLPATIVSSVVIAAFFSAGLISTERRWHYYYSVHQISSLAFNRHVSGTAILSNSGQIQLAQKYLTELGYDKIVTDGIYDTETEFSVKDFQKKFGIRATSYLDQHTMDLLTKFIIIKNSKFKTNNETDKK